MATPLGSLKEDTAGPMPTDSHLPQLKSEAFLLPYVIWTLTTTGKIWTERHQRQVLLMGLSQTRYTNKLSMQMILW